MKHSTDTLLETRDSATYLFIESQSQCHIFIFCDPRRGTQQTTVPRCPCLQRVGKVDTQEN